MPMAVMVKPHLFKKRRSLWATAHMLAGRSRATTLNICLWLLASAVHFLRDHEQIGSLAVWDFKRAMEPLCSPAFSHTHTLGHNVRSVLQPSWGTTASQSSHQTTFLSTASSQIRQRISRRRSPNCTSSTRKLRDCHYLEILYIWLCKRQRDWTKRG